MPNIHSANFQLVHTPLHRATIACNQSVNEHSLFSVAMLSARGGISAISIRITIIFSHMGQFIPQKNIFCKCYLFCKNPIFIIDFRQLPNVFQWISPYSLEFLIKQPTLVRSAVLCIIHHMRFELLNFQMLIRCIPLTTRCSYALFCCSFFFLFVASFLLSFFSFIFFSFISLYLAFVLAHLFMQSTLEYLIRISFGYDECKVYRFNVLTYLILMPHFHFVGTIDIAPRIAACIFLYFFIQIR